MLNQVMFVKQVYISGIPYHKKRLKSVELVPKFEPYNFYKGKFKGKGFAL